ncbi:MAG: helix-turn-helix transcriptional regulator [Schumannella sp.]|nr:helix-turn-helix transcriptional regulator [Schumannella sp.]
MVGRAPELDELLGIAETALEGDPRIVVIGGEAGIGKTRLTEEFTSRLAGDAVVVTGQCVEFGTVGLPYVPLAGIFRGLAAAFGSDAVFEAAGAGRPALQGMIEGAAPVERDERMGIERLDEVVTTLLEQLSARRPLVVIIEDLHWADAATLDVLRFAARVLTGGHLLLVLTYRTDDVGRGHPLRAFLAELERNRRTRRIPLGRLTAEEVRTQVALLLGSAPSPDQARVLFDRSEGVPFFVEELLCVEQVVNGGPVPETMRELLLGRYESLGSDARAVVRVLAAGGARVDHDVVTEVADIDDAVLDDSLREAVDAGVIVVDGRGYDFRHALVREAVSAELLPGESARLHTGYARSLSARSCDPTQRAARAVLVSYHWMEAHDLEKAFAASLEGARLSRAAFAYTSAAQLGERALALWDQVPDPVGASGGSHVELLDFTAVSWRNAGEPQRALATIELALGEADPSQRETVARLLRNKGMMLNVDGRSEAIGVFEQALAVLGADGDRMLRANILGEVAAQYMVSGRVDEAIAASTEALEIAPPTAHRSRSVAANIRGGTLLHEGRIDEGMADYDRAREYAQGDRDALLRYYVNSSDTMNLLGRFAESIALAEQGYELAREAGVERTSGAILTVNTVDPLFALGEWRRADALIDRSLELNPPVVFRNYLRRAKVRSVLWSGDPAAALAHFEHWAPSLTELAEFENQTRAGLALDLADVQFALGDLDAAWAWASPLVTETRIASAGWELPLAPTVARILARRREAGRWGSMDAEEARLREVIARDAWPTRPIWSAFVDAELSGDDRTGTDVAVWLRAREAVQSPEAPALARLLVEYGLARAQVLSGDRADAAETLSRLRASAAAVGAGLIVTWAGELESRAGLAGRATAVDGDRLTGREQQVLDLVAEGLSNGQIAERLYISRKTVSVHVSAILRKTGAASRTEAVRLAAR